jgi:hypothetical protein
MIASEYMPAMQHDDGSLSDADLVADYERGVEELRAAVAGLTTEQCRARPIPGEWSTLEVVCHVAETEICFTDRVERVLTLMRPLLLAVDERSYPKQLHYRSLDLAEELDLFAGLRRHVARILRAQPPEAWERTAVHSETGLITVRQLVFQAVRRVRYHLPLIAERRAALSGKA